MRIALGVEYDGTEFHGWQLQRGVRTVQECLESALGRVADHPVRVHCAGRTDAGVHSSGQVVHFDVDVYRSERSWALGANVNLPPDVSVSWARQVPDEFHARYSALSRRYRYVILNRWTRSAVWHRYAVWSHPPLDVERMHRAGQHLVGEHDFSSFRARDCQANSPVRHVSMLRVLRHTDLVVLEVQANAFLHHMVRNIAGVLMSIGRGDRPEEWVMEVLEHRQRARGGATAPPQGLSLVHVEYPPWFAIPAQRADFASALGADPLLSNRSPDDGGFL